MKTTGCQFEGVLSNLEFNSAQEYLIQKFVGRTSSDSTKLPNSNVLVTQILYTSQPQSKQPTQKLNHKNGEKSETFKELEATLIHLLGFNF